MKICHIFGAAEGIPEKLEINDNDFIIAADAGLLTLENLKIKPHLTVGDFDSLGKIPQNGEVIKHPVKKNDTDTLLAVKIGFERGYKRFYLYGCFGKRFDHTLANIQILSFIAENNGIGYLYGDHFVATAIKEDIIEFSAEQNGNISVFSATDECVISIEGLLYTLKNAKITYDFPLGVSNEFLGKKSKITVHKGTAIIITEK